jgi:hypothetical protein
MDVWTRRLVGFDVERDNIDGVSVCRMFNHAIAGQALPKRVSTDHDPLFRFHRWLANLRVLAIEEVKSIPYAPVSHPFIERLIGTVRRVRVEDWRADLRLRWGVPRLSPWPSIRLPSSRFQPPPLRTQRAGFPHYAHLPASHHGL